MSRSISSLWNSANENEWCQALEAYWLQVKDYLRNLEKRMDCLDLEEIKKLNEIEWYKFLHDEYFKWKYTAKNRLATTHKQLERYIEEGRLLELYKIKEKLLSVRYDNIAEALLIAKSIHGLGTSGASGLLSILYPHWFGTVDQFVVESLGKISNLPDKEIINGINRDSIHIREAVVMIEIMRRKANENNQQFGNQYWTPRKIDMVLWGIRD